MTDATDPIRLTQYSHGAGCGCKISPKVLEEILNQAGKAAPHAQLLVGNDPRTTPPCAISATVRR